jgi:hypothetical protein
MIRRLLATLRSRLAVGASLFSVALLGFGLYAKSSGLLLPGPLSAVHNDRETAGGYVSHAEFENECSHCHAPIHCITDTRCQDCHIDIARQRATASGLHSHFPGVERCQNCHGEHAGRDAVITQFAFLNLNHGKLVGFSLELHTKDFSGAPMNCESCHAQGSFLSDALDCITCHANEDHDNTASHIEAYGADCAACHDGADRMHEFDHNTVYVLDGAHSDKDCQECHIEHNYRSTPQECAGCHAEPDLHAGIFGADCVRCHSTLAWAPASLTQHTFLLDHGSQDITQCETCHAGTYTEYPCYTCHDSEEMRTVHEQYDIKENVDENCVECHPTGREKLAVSVRKDG